MSGREMLFWGKVEKTNTCWLWKGTRRGGYGRFRTDDGLVEAHRFSYETAVGPILLGLIIDHLCRNRACVRPDHLEPVTPKVNTNRGVKRSLQLSCKRGHPLAGSNLRIREDRNNGRECWECHRERVRQYREIGRAHV